VLHGGDRDELTCGRHGAVELLHAPTGGRGRAPPWRSGQRSLTPETRGQLRTPSLSRRPRGDHGCPRAEVASRSSTARRRLGCVNLPHRPRPTHQRVAHSRFHARRHRAAPPPPRPRLPAPTKFTESRSRHPTPTELAELRLRRSAPGDTGRGPDPRASTYQASLPPPPPRLPTRRR
jgi:hypothetical protein